MFFLFKAPSSPPMCFKLLVPSSALRRSRQKYWSSIFPAEKDPGKLWETSNAGRKEGVLQSWAEPHILIKLNITLTTRTKIQVQGILKLPLVLRNSKHHQEHCSKIQCCREKEGALQPSHGCQEVASISSHTAGQNTELCKIHFRSHSLASHVK